MLSIENIKNNNWLLFEAIAGSRAYGLHTEKSDTDIRGVYILPKEYYFGFEYVDQVNNETNDIVYYEIGKFLQLLLKNNPNILELLALPSDCVLYRNPIMEKIVPDMFLSKLCEQTFANYAFAQIKKASGLEKKIVNSMDEVRKSPMSFCYTYQDGKSVALDLFLANRSMSAQHCGLTKLDHMKDCYALYYNEERGYRGIFQSDNSNEVCLSSIDKSEFPIALMYFNRDGYSVYCKQYKEYWDWVALRNETRYQSTIDHGKRYDAKNMMHVFRLLHMAKEIALEQKIHVHRNDRQFLLDVKEGRYEYEELVTKATLLKDNLANLFKESSLPDYPDYNSINSLLIEIRKQHY